MIITAEQIAEALTHRCGLCQAPPDRPCVNICTGNALPDRTVHFYRLGAK